MVSLSAVTFRRYWIARLSDDDYWSVALENNYATEIPYTGKSHRDPTS